MIRVRLSIATLRRKVEAFKRELPKEAEKSLRALANEAIDLVRQAPPAQIQNQIERTLETVFVPVQLKHKRPEIWPNLRPIYQARIVRGAARYQGRKMFYVDENKREALAAELVHRAIERREADVYEVRFVPTFDRRYRVEIVRKGGKGIPSVVVAYTRQRMKVVAASTLSAALSRAGLA